MRSPAPTPTDNQLDDDTGVAIETLTGGHPAFDAELQRDDVIHAVDGHPVKDLEDFLKLYKDSVGNRETDIRLDIHRDRADLTKALKVTYDAATEKDIPGRQGREAVAELTLSNDQNPRPKNPINDQIPMTQ